MSLVRYINLEKDWLLHRYMVRPSRRVLENFTRQEEESHKDDPIVKVELLDPGMHVSESTEPSPIQHIRAKFIKSLGGPFEELNKFPSGQDVDFRLREKLDHFNILRKIMFCVPIDLRNVPIEFIFAANRYKLDFFVTAMYYYIESRAMDRMNPKNCEEIQIPKLPIKEFLQMGIRIIRNLRPPAWFVRHYALRLVNEFDDWEGDGHSGFFNLNPSRPDEVNAQFDPWHLFRSTGMLPGIAWNIGALTVSDQKVIDNLVRNIFRVLKYMEPVQIKRVLASLNWNRALLRHFCRTYDFSEGKEDREGREGREDRGNREKLKNILVQYTRRPIVLEHINIENLESFSDILSGKKSLNHSHKLPWHLSSYSIKFSMVSKKMESGDEGELLMGFRFGRVVHHTLGFERNTKVTISIRTISDRCGCDYLQGTENCHAGWVDRMASIGLTSALKDPLVFKIVFGERSRRWLEKHDPGCSIKLVIGILLQ